MKRLLSILMTTLLLLSCLNVVSAAEPEMTDRLSKVTLKVKNSLSIGDDYTSFHGNLQENGADVYWNLFWEKDDGTTLTINASESGKIMSYNLNVNSEQNYYYDNYFAPAFPSITETKAKKSAETFLLKVLDNTTESFAFNEENKLLNPRKDKNYYLYGNIKLNAIASPIGANITINALDSTVISFSRDDLYTKYIGSVPDNTTHVTKSSAEKLLYDTIKMKLEYTTNSNNLSNEKLNKAVLKYTPIYNGNYVVDAKTGELVNTDQLYDTLKGTTASSEKVQGSASAYDTGFSEVELNGIEKLKDVLSKEALDLKIRAIPELGLAHYTLSNVRYTLDNTTNMVFCSLSYGLLDTKEDTKTISHKNVYVNAKTGQLISVYSNNIGSETKSTFETSDKQKKAEAFLAKYYSEEYAKTQLYSETNYSIEKLNIAPYKDYFTFAQNVNGYFFPENALRISINSETGFVDSFNMHFDDVEFDSTEGIISNEQAIDVYAKTYATKLSYINSPKKIDLSSPEWKTYINLGYTYLYELRLAYTPYFTNKPYSIDAKTGEAMYYDYTQTQNIHYNDANTLEIEELAKFGIGYSTTNFEANKPLTQFDMLALLISADGYVYTPEQGEEALYIRAYNLGIIKKSERDPGKLITKSELVKTILSMSGYGKTADLRGIYICNFSDEKNIKPEYYGFIAIAQGLGMIKANENGSFLPNTNATRGDIGIMLYNFMLR